MAGLYEELIGFAHFHAQLPTAYNRDMDIRFPDTPPIDPMDGDYLCFEAIADGKPVRCCVTFDVLTPKRNNPGNAMLAFAKKRDQLCATARALIEAGEAEDGELLITTLP